MVKKVLCIPPLLASFTVVNNSQACRIDSSNPENDAWSSLEHLPVYHLEDLDRDALLVVLTP